MKRLIIGIMSLLLMSTGCVWGNSTLVTEETNSLSGLESSMSSLPVEAQSLLDIELPACVRDATVFEVAYVTRVIDGDSIEVSLNGVEEQVRYIGVNTPEYYSDEREDAITATDLNRELVEGRYVLLIKDVSERDKFERLLRYVFTEDYFVNYELVEEGVAEVKSYPPDTACHEYLSKGD